MSEVKLTPLGGFGETGALNCLLYDNGRDAILVDSGIAFPDKSLPGVSLVRPDFSSLESLRSRLRALVLTHGHEDHMGSLPFLLRQFPIPVHSLPFAASLTREKAIEFGLQNIQIVTHRYDAPFQVGSFQLEYLFVNHSIPDASGLLIQSENFKLLHLTDFKIDYTPLEGRVTDLKRFSELGDAGLDALLMDSTNVFKTGHTLSEKVVREHLTQTIKSTKGRIFVCLFSSNVRRLQSLVDAARATNRVFAMTGRSTKSYSRVAMDLGLMDLSGLDVVDVEDTFGLPDERVMIVVTGSQAEERSVLMRMSHELFKPVRLQAGDTILMSSKIIPGNEGPVLDMIDRLTKLGAEVVLSHPEHPLHASGHAYQDELMEVIRRTKPRVFIPLHGSYSHLQQHKKLALAAGLQGNQSVVMLDGTTLCLGKTGVRKTEELNSGRVYISENPNYIISEEAVKRRRKLALNGLVTAAVVFDAKKKTLCGEAHLHSQGLFGGDVEVAALRDLSFDLKDKIKKQKLPRDKLEKFFKVEIRHFYKARFQIRPEVVVMISDI